jgi:hypothetical protein
MIHQKAPEQKAGCHTSGVSAKERILLANPLACPQMVLV